ncbi:MAG: discoidin domain-containing protein [Clostridia bacterium]|nr:discoidin domain-containing protein [Clostridia bacterium]
MKRRIIGTILAAVLLLANYAVCIPASAEENDVPILIYSCLDFEEQEAGQIPYGFYWSWGEEAFSVVNAADDENQNNKAAQITYSGEGDIPRMQLPLHYAPIADNFVFGFRFKNEDPISMKRLSVATDATQPRNTLYLDTTGTAFNIMTISAGVLQVGTQKVSIKENEWYEIEFEINMGSKQMNVYLNDDKFVSKEALPNTGMVNVAGLTFFAPDKAASWCIDDFRLYMGDKKLSDEELSEQWSYYENSDIIPEHKYELGRLFQYDKFVFLTLYNKFVARIDGNRFYKDNKYHTLSTPITENDGVITVPVRDFSEVFGAQVLWDDGLITVINGENTLQMRLGDDLYYKNGKLARMLRPVVLENGKSVAQLEVLTSFFGISYKRVGELLMFGDELKCPYDLGVMVENQRGYTMEGEVFQRIENSLIYERPSKELVLESFENHNPEHKHPRLLINDFDTIKNNLDSDEEYKRLVNQVIAKGDGYVELEPVAYTKSDGLRGDFQQPLSDRGTYLSFAYAMTGDEKYKNAMWANLAAVAEFPDLNPNHFLDVGVSANGIKFAADWMYDGWTEEQKETIEKIILEKVLAPAIAGYRSPMGSNATGFAYNIGNQPIIINCGIAGCALALLDKYPDICSEVISCAIRSVETCLGEFAPDGAWTEGVSYWQYTMGSLPALVNIFRTALGDDFGLLSTPGLHKSAYFPLGVSGASGTFPMGDDASISPYHASLMWFANVYGDKALANMRKASLNGAGITDVLNWVFDSEGESATIENDHYFRKMETATMRTGWNASDTAVILHGGMNNTNHGHIDIGTFQVDMLGERWACEVPKEEYNILYYGSYVYDSKAPKSPYGPSDYYRYKAEGHNTVIANLGSSRADQVPEALAEIVKYSSKKSGAYAILDMTQTNPLYKTAARGVKLDKYNNEVIVQDDFRAVEETEFWWFMHTQADIELSADKKTAILSKNNKRVWVSIISDGDETFQVMPAQSMEGYYAIPPLQGDNSAYQKLAVRKKTDRFQLSVAIKPLYGNADKPVVIPKDQYMSEWRFEDVDPERLASVTVNGAEYSEFDKDVFNYTIKVPTEKSAVPDISAVAENADCELEYIKADKAPGTTTVLLKKEGAVVSSYNFIIQPVNDTRKFLNDKQIPIMDYKVTSEPESNNPASHLFDADFSTRFSTDEQGGYLILDYGEVVNLYEVKMAFTNGDARSDLFTLEVSTDGQNYTQVYDGGGNGQTKDYQSFIVGPVQARYLKVSFHGNSNGSAWASVSELCSFTQ